MDIVVILCQCFALEVSFQGHIEVIVLWYKNEPSGTQYEMSSGSEFIQSIPKVQSVANKMYQVSER